MKILDPKTIVWVVEKSSFISFSGPFFIYSVDVDQSCNIYYKVLTQSMSVDRAKYVSSNNVFDDVEKAKKAFEELNISDTKLIKSYL